MSDPDVEMFDRNLMKSLVADNEKLQAEIERLRADRNMVHEQNVRLRTALRAILAETTVSDEAEILRGIAARALAGGKE